MYDGTVPVAACVVDGVAADGEGLRAVEPAGVDASRAVGCGDPSVVAGRAAPGAPDVAYVGG